MQKIYLRDGKVLFFQSIGIFPKGCSPRRYILKNNDTVKPVGKRFWENEAK